MQTNLKPAAILALATRINSSEWGIALENPTTEELYAFIKGER